MQPSLERPTRPSGQGWVYASLAVLDGPRQLKPAQVGPDLLLFDEPPHLISDRVEIILRNGTSEQRHFAVVLPHDADAKRISIQLLPPHHISTDTQRRRGPCPPAATRSIVTSRPCRVTGSAMDRGEVRGRWATPDAGGRPARNLAQ